MPSKTDQKGLVDDCCQIEDVWPVESAVSCCYYWHYYWVEVPESSTAEEVEPDAEAGVGVGEGSAEDGLEVEVEEVDACASGAH